MSTPTIDYVPPALNAAGKGALHVAATVANPQSPKLTEYAAASAFRIHCDLDAWGPQLTHPLQDRGRYCLDQNTQQFGVKSWAQDPLVVVYDPQQPTSVNYQAYLKLVEGLTFWVFDRRGKSARNAALAVADIGDMVQITVGGKDRVPITLDGASVLQSRIFVAIGQVYQDVAMVA